MATRIDPGTLKSWIHDTGELALFDVREAGQFGESHLLYAVPLPWSRLEIDVVRLAPTRSVRTVLVDEDGEIALRAAARLEAIGYSDVSVLEGGNRAWAGQGHPLFAGVNVPSKAFGELAEHVYHTPSVSAAQLAKMLEQDPDLVVLDGRPLTEYAKMSIPRAACCPNGELALRARSMVSSDSTTIVINCAGRTRSIIGAQSLINLGVKNPVYALENGTQGWMLGGFKLEHGATRRYPEKPEPAHVDAARAMARGLVERFQVPRVDADTLQRWLADTTRTTFFFDVRSPEEFAAGGATGAEHAPGGQLVQATDQYVGVRGARIVLWDSDGVRAPVVAHWLRQLGHEVALCDAPKDGVPASRDVGSTAHAGAIGLLPEVDAAECRDDTVATVDLRPSPAYRKSHAKGARWSIRQRIASDLAKETRPIVLIADDPRIAALAAGELAPVQRERARLLRGGHAAWVEAKLPVESTPAFPPDNDCIDYLYFVHDRHDGNLDAARRYLAWELGLVAQLDARELAGFKLPVPDPSTPADH